MGYGRVNCSEFRCHSEFGNEWRVQEGSFAIISEYSIDLLIVSRMLEVLVLSIMVQVVIESRVVDSVYIDMVVCTGERFSEKRVMPLDVSSMGRVQVF